METQSSEARRHIWPWFVAAGLVIGVAASIIWMRAEIRRTKERQNYRYDVPITNSPAPR